MSYKSGWLLVRYGKGLVDSSSPVSAQQETWVELYDDRLIVKKSSTTSAPKPASNDSSASANANRASVNDDDVRTVKVTKSSTGLDFSIKGGAEHGLPILISRIFENGAAAKTGQLNTGDCILEVNGVNLDGATHEQAVAALKGVDRVAIMKVRFHSQAHARLTTANKAEEKKASTTAASERPVSSDWGKLPTPDAGTLTDLYSIPLEKMILTRHKFNSDETLENGVVVRAFDHSLAAEFIAHDNKEADEWFTAISTIATNMYSTLLGTLKKNVPEPFNGKPKKSGFVAQFIESSWRYYFAVVTDYDLNLFVAVPDHLDNPHKSYPLTSCRLASLDDPSRRVDRKENAFVLLHSEGVIAYFAGETKEDRHHWVKALQSGSIRASKASEDLVFKGIYCERDVVLSLLWEDGIKLSKFSNGTSKTTFWKYKPHQLLSTSHHDKTLTLTFVPDRTKPDRTIVEQIEFPNVRAVMHALYNMLQARVIDAEPLPTQGNAVALKA